MDRYRSSCRCCTEGISMINPNTKLTVLHDNNSVFTEHSEIAAEYLRDDFSIDLSSTEDYLYIGFTKNFGSIYMELTTPNLNANTLAAEYYDGTIWVSLDLTDETQGMTRSGFMFWDKSVMNTVEIDSIDRFYIRLRPSNDHSSTSVRGVNLVFSDDTMLKAEFFQIDETGVLPSNQDSHINHHVAARNTLVQYMRNEGYLKKDSNAATSIIDQWDLIDIFEIREAASFLALNRIFFNLSDNIDDHWWAKYLVYKKRYERALVGLTNLSLDLNDDGIDSAAEKNAPTKTARWSR